jgi:hypothetical protein
MPDQAGVEPDSVLGEEEGSLNCAAVGQVPAKLGPARGYQYPLCGLRLEIAVSILAVVNVDPREISRGAGVEMLGDAVT